MATYEYRYPHPAVTTDCVVFGFDGRELKVLLIERGLEPYKGMWAFPGGFMRIDETAEQCAIRELKEETGMVLTQVRQLGAFSGVHRDPRERVVTIAFYALARQSEVIGGDDAAHARWWPIKEIPQLAFDHDYILRRAMERIRQDIHFEPVGFGLMEEEFTIADLQRLYESILGVHFDRRNFYRKMMQTGILQEVEEEPYIDACCEETQPCFYGKNMQMKKMSIDNLFDDLAVKGKSHPSPDGNANNLLCEDEIVRSHGVGRKGKLFRFDPDSYDRMKESGNFRLEF